ncbi:MAG TPA: hypothetical protein VGK37_00960 [Casimicrobiaceae bacterium]
MIASNKPRLPQKHQRLICTEIIFPLQQLFKEQTMSRKQYSLATRLAIATALAIGTSGVALADDSSMNPFTGDFYRELHGGQSLGNSNLARATSMPATDTIAECAKPDEQKIAQQRRWLVLTPTPIFSDKGA